MKKRYKKMLFENFLAPLFDAESSESSSTGTGTGTTRAVRVFRKLALQAPTFKNHAFSSEKEFRLIVRTKVPPDSDESPDQWNDRWFEGFPSPIGFAVANGRLVPFTEIPLQADVIRSVGLGPKFGGYENEMSMKLFLDRELEGE